MNQSEQFDVVVIGGGASGMMAAIVAAQSGKRVVILEKNKTLGNKLDITGGGRCNITNAESDMRKFLLKYGKASQFLFSAFSRFSNKDTFNFFESKGLPLITQELQRVFPKSEKATDVTKVLKNELKKYNISIYTKCVVQKINHDVKKIINITTSQGNICGKSYVLATGGMSHPETGSTGDGFIWLQELGHTVRAATPTITPLSVDDTWATSIPGTKISDIKITFFANKIKQFSKTGAILFTHFGISGPLILNSSTQVADLMHGATVTAKIDLFPQKNLGELEKEIINHFNDSKNKNLKTVLKEIIPAGLIKGLELLLPAINFDTKVHSVTKDDRKKIIHCMKELPLLITGLMGFEKAVVADGGVDLKEIDMATMQSKKINNLFVTGDLLHINRPSGGYSLQLCWTTGYLAGISV